ncbi:hypothetical protein ABKV19_007412 [Rosa sericea]
MKAPKKSARLPYLPELPQEIWSRIFLLAKVPVKFLGQWRCVCKCWNGLIGSPAFIDAYDESEAGKTHLLLVKSGMSRGGVSLFCSQTNRMVLHLRPPRLERQYRFCIIGSCKGLVCISLQFVDSVGLAIWNPSIGKLQELPECLIQGNDGDSDSATAMGFGFGKNDYKLVRITPPSDTERTYGVEVYSLRLDCWRRITTVSQLNGSCSVHFQRRFATYFEGAVYWIYWIGDESHKYILCFNIDSETFTTLPLIVLIPGLLRTSTIDVSVGVFKNSLALFHMREEGGFIFCEIWVRSSIAWDYIQHLMHPVSFKVASPLSGTTDHRFHVVLKNVDWPDHHLVLYDLISRNFDDSGIELHCSHDNYVDEYRESLMLLE